MKLLVLKVPSVEERNTTSSSSPLGQSILHLIFYPLFLVATCRRSSELWNPNSITATGLTWASLLTPTPAPAVPSNTHMSADDVHMQDMEGPNKPAKVARDDSSVDVRLARVTPEVTVASTSAAAAPPATAKLETAGRLVCYAFYGMPVSCPPNFM